MKLGFKPGVRIACLGAPPNYFDLLQPLPDGLEIATRLAKDLDGIHLFVDRRSRLERAIPSALRSIGLVDIKVCAVDETWSALKLVIRKALRKR